MIEILSPAKINCFLYVTKKRDDGNHELESLMACIELYDEIKIEKGLNNKIDVFCDHPDVPDGEKNIAFKAALLFYRNFFSENGIIVKIKKNIPVGAGLGGGSSNAASVLMALNTLHGHLFSKSELMEMGLALGADVPFFIYGSPSIARGVGEILTKYEKLSPYHIIICYPGVVASTREVFKNFDIKLTEKSKLDISTPLNVWSDIQGKAIDVANFMHNDLENVAYDLYPEIARTKEEMEFVLSEKVCMTGSGSSLFVFFVDRTKADQAYALLSDRWKGSTKEVFLTSFKT